ncbi:MAG TPA: esterase-like activity of phytase family protein [Allosphingosinicella sp.]|nr:esterase-like activity of phytase family protein [Allosphingosinicella sp.]
MKLGGFPERNWRGRWPRILFLGAALPLLATVTRPGPSPPPPGPGEGRILVSAVALDAARPERRAVGGLRFLAGWSLASDDLRFGGISGLHLEGGEVIAISDVGMVARFPVPVRAGRLPVRFDPLIEGPGPRSPKSNRDTEALLVRGDRLWAGFERQNMIWRYDRSSLRVQSAARPAAMRRWGGNRGAEALVRLDDGRFLVMAEGRDDGGAHSDVVLFEGDPSRPAAAATALRFRRPPGYRATDAALLPDGRILILSRRFSVWDGFTARLTVANVSRLAAGATIEGREIAALAPPLTVDNMEAMAVTRENGRTIVWLASDDNFSPLQRTLLLKFELIAEPSPG